MRSPTATLLLLTWLGAAVTGSAAAAVPRPSGPLAVGFTRFELTDPSRSGVMSGTATEPRTIPVYAWYPARRGKGRPRTYFEAREAVDQGRAMERNFHYRPGELSYLAQLTVASRQRAAALPGRFPLVIFSHGYFSYPAQNSFLAEELASHGFIVLALGHLHDGVDLRLGNGWLMPTLDPPGGDDAALMSSLGAIAGGVDLDRRTAALPDYPARFRRHRLGASLEAWVADTRYVAKAAVARAWPSVASRYLAGADPTRIVLAGMSFGGTTAASTCRLVATCVAAVNLDGEAFDPGLFDHPVERPLLMIHSDWTHYPLWPQESVDPAFNPNDLAFEPWMQAGQSRDIVRLRLAGARHMAFTDLPLLLPQDATARFGTIAPKRAVGAVNAVVLAFVEHFATGAPRETIDRAIARNPELVRHDPAPIARWALAGQKSIRLGCWIACDGAPGDQAGRQSPTSSPKRGENQ